MAASARFLRAAGASASACAASRARAANARASSLPALPELPTALSGAFMALIRLAFTASYHVRREPGEAAAAPMVVHSRPQRFAVRSQKRRNLHNADSVSPVDCTKERVMGLPIDRPSSRLPRRFPVGAKYVVEGYGGDRWQVSASLRAMWSCRAGSASMSHPIFPARRRRARFAFRRNSSSKQSPAKARAASGGKKFAAAARNRLAAPTLMVRRRAKPPSPSPSITRR